MVWTLLVLCLLWAGPTWAVDRWVSLAGNNGNAGTQSSPYRDIQFCINASQPGDTCTVGAGTFTERLTFPTSGTPSARITIQGTLGAGGSFDTVIDGSSPTAGWVAAPEIGSGVWKATLGSPQALMANGLTIWRIHDVAMNGTVPLLAKGNGDFYLRQAANATVNVATCPAGTGNCILFWDGIEALFGNKSNGTTYLRFRNGTNPASMNVRAAPAGGVVTISGRHNITVRRFKIIGGHFAVRVTGGSQNAILEQNHLTNGVHRVRLDQGGGQNTIIRQNTIRLDMIGMVAFPPGDRDVITYARRVNRWQYDCSKFIIGTTEVDDSSIEIGTSSGTQVLDNDIGLGVIGLAFYGVNSGTTISGNTFHQFSDIGIYINSDYTGTNITNNLFWDAEHHMRIQSTNHNMDVFIFANKFHNMWYAPTGNAAKHIFVGPPGLPPPAASPSKIWIYHNSFAGGGWSVDMGGVGEFSFSFPQMHVLNNMISANGGISSGGLSMVGEVSSNRVDTLWYNNTIPTFVLPAGHSARNSAPNLIPRGLPGMTAAYYQDGAPDHGAIQGTGGGSPPTTQLLSVQLLGAGNGSVSSSPGGITCGGTCSAEFATNTSVTLTATATAPSTFQGWSGEGCSGTGTCVVPMSQTRTVAATFEVPVIEPPPPAPSLAIGHGVPYLPFQLPFYVTGSLVDLAAFPLPGLQAWWRVVTPLSGGQRWADLRRAAYLSLTNFAVSPWQGTARPGGDGEVRTGAPTAYLTTESRYGANGPFTAVGWARRFVDGNHLDLIGQINTGFTQGWGIWLAGSDNKLRCAINNGDNAAVAPAAFPMNQWVQVACTWDGTSLRLYQDGVLQSSITASSSYPTGLPLTLGALPGYTNGGWVGAIDDWMVYDRALPLATLVALRDLSTQGYPGLLRRVSFNFPVEEEGPPAPPAPGPVIVVPFESSFFFVP